MIASFLWLVAAAAQSAAPVHPLAIEAHLALLVGDWTRAGKEATYRDHCVWYGRHAFVVCSLTDSSSLRVEVIVGYSKDEQRFTYQSYSNGGDSHIQYGYALGTNGIVLTDERKVDGKPARLTTSLIPQPDGRLRITQEKSVMGGLWQQVAEVYYVARR